MTPLKLLRTLIGLLIAGMFLSHATGLHPLAWLQQLEQYTYDYRLRATMPGGLDQRVVIVDIDDRSLSTEGHWPWGRDKLARLVDTLFDHYAIGLLGFDVVFAEYDERSGLPTLDALAQGELAQVPAYLSALERLRPTLDRDHLFAESLRDRDVILGFSASADHRFGQLPEPILTLDDSNRRIPFHQVRGYNANLPELQQAAWGGGYFDNSSVDNDGVFRRLPLLQRIDERIYPTLSLAMLRGILGMPDTRLEIHSTINQQDEELGLEAVRVGDLRIPVDERAGALIPYRGTSGSFRYVSATDVLARKVPSEWLDGVIVLIGTTAPGLLDLRSTPVQNSYPGVEVHANLLAGMLDQRIRHHPAWTIAVDSLVLAGITLFGLTLLPRLAPLPALLATLVVFGGLSAANFHAWHGYDLALPLAAQLILLGVLFGFANAWGFFIENRSTRRLRYLFGQYVPPEIVGEMSRQGGSFGVEGESREMSVFFSDIRSFTSISERMEPDELKRMINAYLTPMTQLIHDYRGTVDKYIGDAVMAFWGAPLPDPDHARQAVLTALAMSRAMEQVRADFRARGWPEIRIGMGVNSGRMNVGNMGSEFRMSYTVLGDAVNLGSRLEGLTKQYGVEILISQFTRELVPDLPCRELDLVRVKGKVEPVGVYEPLGESAELPEALARESEQYHRALLAYRNQQWDLAETILNQLGEEHGERPMYRLYLDRIAHLRGDPPGADWDAVFTATSK